MESENVKQKQKAFQIRLPLSIYERLEEIAGKNRRSLNSETIIILEEYFNMKEVLKGERIEDMYNQLKENIHNLMERISEFNELNEMLDRALVSKKKNRKPEG
ncbi:MAG: Arc family DNA-binding protein [Treponema sp.]|nr:Arc family DNA-binding protein [Treponema sp.]